MTHSSTQSLPYRPDIDGLRAIAVIAVVIYHLFPTLLPGGYVGVDVFFVISGYLISFLIFKELLNNCFSLIDFYGRRIKRLFPTLLMILFFTAIAGWFLYLPFDYTNLGELMAASTTFSSNISLSKGTGYFNIDSTYKPLLHIWSLSLEEQFYILFPPSVILFFKKSKNWLLLVLILSFIASFIFNIHYVSIKPSKAFYLLPPRAWELLLGALYAYICCFQFSPSILRWIHTHRTVLSTFGLVLLVYSCVTFHDKILFPSWSALLPTGGTLLLIMTPGSWIHRRFLSHWLPVQIGLMSYALYLWHWPLFSFAQIYTEGQVTILTRLFILGASFILAWITTQYVEKPVRAASSKVLFPLIGLMLIIFGLSGLISSNRLKPLSGHLNSALHKVQFALKDWIIYKPSARDHIAFPFPHFGEGPEIVLFFGDSNMEQYQPRVEKLMTDDAALQQKYTAIFAYQRCQIPLPDHPNGEKALKFMSQVQALVEKSEVTTVVVGAEWTGYLRGFPEKASAYYASLHCFLTRLQTLHKTVYLMANIPVGMAYHPRQLIVRNGPFDWQLSSQKTVNAKPWFDSAHVILDRLKSIAQETGTRVIDPCDTLCFNQHCLLMDDNHIPIYRDDAHLTASYVRDHATFIDQIFLK